MNSYVVERPEFVTANGEVTAITFPATMYAARVDKEGATKLTLEIPKSHQEAAQWVERFTECELLVTVKPTENHADGDEAD